MAPEFGPDLTRDLLAQQARERGMSLSTMLERLARQAALLSERNATRADAADGDLHDDDRAWDVVLSDGLD
jgi:hypothetical protein